MPDPRSALPPAFLAADPGGDDTGHALLDVPDTADRNTTRYAGPRPGDGEQTVDQDREPVAGSPVGAANRPAPDRHRPRRFRKLPIVVEAIQWTPASTEAVQEFLADRYVSGGGPGRMKVLTVHGTVPIVLGDWIVCDILGEFWPCRSDVFEATYEPTGDPVTAPGDPETFTADPGGPWGSH